jgi:hypothetical protein
MDDGTRPHPDDTGREEPADERPAVDDTDAPPAVSACESAPGRVVLLESGNTDGWLSSDVTVTIDR